MSSPDLVSVMERVADEARVLERGRSGRPLHHSAAIIHALSGVCPPVGFRRHDGPEGAAVVCLAKSVLVMASMLAATAGGSIPIAGVLDDLGDEAEDARPARYAQVRDCLGCGRAFRSEHFGHRLCDCCRSSAAGSAAIIEFHGPLKRR